MSKTALGEHSSLQLLKPSEQVLLYSFSLTALLSTILTALSFGFISHAIAIRSLVIAFIGAVTSLYLVRVDFCPRNLLSGVILFFALVTALLDARHILPGWLYGMPTSKVFVAISARDAVSLLMLLIVVLLSLKHLQLLDRVDFGLVLLLEFVIYVLMMPFQRSLYFVLYFLPYGVSAIAVLLLLQCAYLRALSPLVDISGWESILRRSLFREMLSLSLWVIVFAVTLSYGLTSFERLSGWLSKYGEIKFGFVDSLISKCIEKYFFRTYSMLPMWGFSLSLRSPSGGVSDTVVLRVESSVAGYWRLCAYDYYKNGTWRRKLKWKTKLLEEDEELSLTAGDDRYASVKTMKVMQIVHIERGSFIYLPALFRPTRLDADLDHVSYDPSGTIRSRKLLTEGFSYTVWSEVKLWRYSLLAGTTLSFKRGELEGLERYLQLPESIKPQLELIATSITAGAGDPFEKALAIRRYLKRNLSYDEKYPITPANQDPVLYFLTVSRKGTCVHFASAMVLLCRASGIPARLVTGFAIGEWDEGKRCFIVRERDAHAWAEVYLPKVGWVAMDPTPGYSIPEPRVMIASAPLAESTWWDDFKTNLILFWEGHDVLISVCAIVLVLIGFSLFVLMHTPSVFKLFKRKRTLKLGDATRLFAKAVKLVARRYRMRRSSETAIEYATSVAEALPLEAQKTFMLMAELYTEAVYGRGRHHNLHLMRLLLGELKKALRKRATKPD